ncbi:DedA family protein [Brachybacterium hainanense]|uniref:DedA family protein n=1 Tax=Brachybacterium hainanense TaxID=1541174 RepID=A0ABV6RCT8_9MICO
MDALLALMEATVASPWLYALIFAAALVDVLLPVVPAETMVIAAGAFAAAGTVDPAALIAASAGGALCGDLLAHQLGRGAGGLACRLRQLRGVRALLDWAERGLAERGGAVIIGGRFLPGGRTAVGLTSGIVRYPRARFAAFTAVAGVLWSLYSVGIGMAGGAMFAHDPLVGVALGIGIAVLVGGAAELLRMRRMRQSARTGRPRTGASSVSPQSAPAQGSCVP